MNSGKTSNLPDGLLKYVKQYEFRRKYGDWQNEGGSELLLDENEEPMVLWYCSPKSAGEFVFGENAGGRFSMLLDSDTDKIMLFQDNKEQAVAYAFSSYVSELKKLSEATGELAEAFRYLQGRIGIRDVIRYVRDSFPQHAEQFSVIDINAQRPISSLSQDTRFALINLLDSLHSDLEAKRRKACNAARGKSIPERYKEINLQVGYLEYLKGNIKSLKKNDPEFLSCSRDGSTAKLVDNEVIFLNEGGKGNVSLSADEKGRFFFNSPQEGMMYADSMNGRQETAVFSEIETNLDATITLFNRDIEHLGFTDGISLHPVFIKMSRPLAHDYMGSTVTGTYVPQPQYQTSYVISRQVCSARAKGCDGVIYRNIADPLNSTSYGVFSQDRVVSIPKHLFPNEILDVRIKNISPERHSVLESKTESFAKTAEECLRNGTVKSFGDFRDGWSLIRRADGKYNYADINGNFMTSRWFDRATEFKSGKALVEREGHKCEINSQGIITQTFGLGMGIDF